MILRARIYCSHDCRETGTLRALRRRLAGGGKKSAATMGRYCRDNVKPKDRADYLNKFAKPWAIVVRQRRLRNAARGMCLACGDPVQEGAFS